MAAILVELLGGNWAFRKDTAVLVGWISYQERLVLRHGGHLSFVSPTHPVDLLSFHPWRTQVENFARRDHPTVASQNQGWGVGSVGKPTC